ELEAETRDAADLGGGIGMRVDAAPLAIGEALDAARLAEIEAARKLAQDDEIDAVEHAVLARGRLGERGNGDDGPEIGIEVEAAAQPQEIAGAAGLDGDGIESGSAGGAKEDGIDRAEAIDRRR